MCVTTAKHIGHVSHTVCGGGATPGREFFLYPQNQARPHMVYDLVIPWFRSRGSGVATSHEGLRALLAQGGDSPGQESL